VLAAFAGIRPVLAQTEAVVEAIAPVLAAEDARRFDATALDRGARSPDALVRRTTALAAGRIGDSRALPLLLTLFADPDSTVRPTAAFALGLLRDTAAVGAVIGRLGQPPALDAATVNEAVTALARIGGPRAADWFGGVLERRVPLVVPDTAEVIATVVAEAWRLDYGAPSASLLPFLRSDDLVVRGAAVYSLGRLRIPEAAGGLIMALDDRDAQIRASAARALTRGYGDEAELTPATTAGLLVRALDDRHPDVRISALRSLATYADSAFSRDVALRMDDAEPHVRLQAISTLGALGGAAAGEALARVVASDQADALRREALVQLARVDTTRFLAAAESWRGDPDWRARAAAAAGFARVPGRQATLLDDADPRVVTAALDAWLAASRGVDSALVAAARGLATHRDAAVRSLAATAIGRAPAASDLPLLTTMYERAGRDTITDAEIAALGAIASLAESSPTARTQVASQFLARASAPDRYIVRLWALDGWPAAAERWPAAYPLTTGRTLQDYREIARRFIADTGAAVRPRVVIETEQRGSLEVELLGPDAPLTVANFLRLVDRRYFDGSSWHRVVPGFVVQDGDPRGDGWGGAGTPIRDEINRNRYVKPVLGMALSGADTGTSQWFINLAPQPHLDGAYTVFGRIVGNQGPLGRILPGDVIRTIRR
jgi:cyclophilin family peptidyl-prolyl cis-trans isomerase/HEAT repeat protein